MTGRKSLDGYGAASQVNDDARNIPPSTITAQIVGQHSRHQSQGQEHVHDDVFAQLLEEVRANPESIENDVEANCQLVRVVTRAGLEKITSPDPFVAREGYVGKAIACIDVIEIALRQTPEILTYVNPQTEGSNSTLCLWLLPRVFSAVNLCDTHPELSDPLQRLLASMVHVLRSRVALKSDYNKIVQLYQSCVEDLIQNLESFHEDPSRSFIARYLPSLEARHVICDLPQQSIVLEDGCQAQVDNSQHAITLLLFLVAPLCNEESKSQSKSFDGRVPPRISMWTLRILFRCFTAIFGSSENRIAEASGEAVLILFRTIRDACLSEMNAHCCSVVFRKAGLLLVKCATAAGVHCASDANPKVQIELENLLALVRRFIEQLHRLSQENVSQLEQVLLNISKDQSTFQGLSSSLQAMISSTVDQLTSVVQQKNGTNTTNNICSRPNFDGIPNEATIVENKKHATDSDRPLKRQKFNSSQLRIQTAKPQALNLLDSMCSLLGDWNRSHIENLESSVSELFSDLVDKDKRALLHILVELPCSGAKRRGGTAFDRRLDISSARCDCEQFLNSESPSQEWEEKHWNCFGNILAALTQSTAIQSSKQQRILLMKAITTLVRHTPDDSYRELGDSSLGRWCLQNLSSSSRELRIAAGYALTAFLQNSSVSPNAELCRRNRVIALDMLRQLTISNDDKHLETSILALGQIACACGDDEMNIVLLRLVEHLGHANSLICAAAHLELRHIANVFGSTVDQIMKPFWKSIATTVVKDLLTRPQKAQQLSDLLGLNVSQFLMMTQSETLPYLVLWKRHDILEKLAKIRDPSKASIWHMCMVPQNLTSILSLLIVQNPADLENTVLNLLLQASSDFKGEDVSNLLKVDPISIACDVLKIAGGEEEGPTRERAIEGFRCLTVVIERKGQPAKTSSTQARMAEIFFENHALGIMASFSDTIDSPNHSEVEKRQCLRAIERMIDIARSNIRVALPQIHACLQSALDNRALRDDAISAGTALLSAVEGDEDLEGVIMLIFTALVQNWEHLSALVQQRSYDAIATLFKTHGVLIQNIANSIPSLASLPLLSKFESQLARLRSGVDTSIRIRSLTTRCRDENSAVVLQALQELAHFLQAQQHWVYETGSSEQPGSTISELVRSLLDACVRFKESNDEILELCTKCIGVIGCLDPNKVESMRAKKEIVILSNFSSGEEAVDFVAFLLENILVKAFHSVFNPRAQGFLAYVMQELLKFCRFNKETTAQYRAPGSQTDDIYQRWNQMPESVQATLRPFLSSRYVLTTHSSKSTENQTYPIFRSDLGHGNWLRTFVFDHLQKANGQNSKQIFGVLSRIIRGYDITIAGFLLPYVAANVIIGGTEREANDVGQELFAVLAYPTKDIPRAEVDHIKSCSENVFQVLDYLSKWVQEKKRQVAASHNMAARMGKQVPEVEEITNSSQIKSVESVLAAIPAEIISRRAVECGSYARALFHWEQFIRQEKDKLRSGEKGEKDEFLFQRLQNIYTEIDEPDGIDGISAYLQVLTPDQQVLEHKRAGRWAAAQSWYELEIQQQPENLNLHVDLLNCLQQVGKHHQVIDHVSSMSKPQRANSRVLSMLSKSAWCTNRWSDLERHLEFQNPGMIFDFNSFVARAMLALRGNKPQEFASIIRNIRLATAKTFSESNTASLQAAHDQLLKLHATYELEALTGNLEANGLNRISIQTLMNRRLGILGSYLNDKQYLLGLRRAAMTLSDLNFTHKEIASSWMSSAKLARKENWTSIAYDSVLHATNLGDESAKIEQARLLWQDGEHRKAILSLEGAIDTNAFHASTDGLASGNASFSTAVAASTRGNKQLEQNLLLAKANLLLAKWLDASGQTQSTVINLKYQLACRSFAKWEKGFYHLGKFYNKLLESQKHLPPSKQNSQYLSGETTKLVVENLLRGLVFGCKYLFETMPKLLTLWLDFGVEANQKVSHEVSDDIRMRIAQTRPKMLDAINKHVRKYIDKISAYLFYTALPQMITRMGHSNKEVYDILASIIIKVVTTHPQQGLWHLLAVTKSSVHQRAHRGNEILNRLKEKGKNIRNEGQSVDLKSLVQQGQRLSDQLVNACEVNIEGRAQNVSLSKELGFNHKAAPCPLVVPLERTLSANLPGASDYAQLKQHKPFPMSREAVTISAFMDEVLVLNSLQKPRKITVRGSNGQKYGLLCKPNDDLRKDQRLMEFNAMINRSLKKDPESGKRRLYVKTYAVTPLNEACGLIEWVDGLKPMRDILITSYRSKGIKVDYNLLRDLLNQAGSSADGHQIFTNQILKMYPPVLHEWFSDLFPDPDSWFAARLRYTRSCAVSSMVGYALGLGDRHGENVLIEENSGGIFHVDFNCLFEKGLTFDKPELVPFRLTHNMVDAFGAYKVEGPFRRSAEFTMKVMRAHEDALLTILETFVYDPTADFVGTRKRTVKGVPETPREVLDSVRSKVRGLMKGESVPLSVGGHVDALITAATDPKNLCAMYIGWCAFL